MGAKIISWVGSRLQASEAANNQPIRQGQIELRQLPNPQLTRTGLVELLLKNYVECGNPIEVHFMASSAAPAALQIEVISDVVCPWCYIGKHRLEAAIALKPDVQASIKWRPYFLNPWIPPQGIDRQTYLKTKFGSVERYSAIAERVAATAVMEGLRYAPDRISRQPNTLDCHRLILWSHSIIDPAFMKQRLMELYFAEGADLTDPKILVQAAADCGMDGDLVRRLLSSETDVDRVESEATSAQEAGIDGVPCFIFGGSVIITGAQSPEYLASAIERGRVAAHAAVGAMR